MKKFKFILFTIILISIAFSLTPYVVPQVGTYTFHGAAGNQKILAVRTANNDSLNVVFGSGYVGVLETSFGPGALMVGAKSKSLVTNVNISYKLDLTGYGLGIYDAALYNTSNWAWTKGSFNSDPDSVGDLVYSLYDPNNITQIVNFLTFGLSNVTIQNAAAYFAQLPTSVSDYLDEIVWAPKWENVGNTVVHHAVQGDLGLLPTLAFFTYSYNCTETWTWDSTYGAWIGYKCQANGTTIYEFSIELAVPAIPGYDLSLLLGITAFSAVGIIYVIMKKKR
jgi:hypothetical protein